MTKPRGISLHIGINMIDKAHYGWDGPIPCCENDADTIRDIAVHQGFETRQLKTREATRDAVKSAILDVAGKLSAGDFFLLSYSGHGGQIPDKSLDEEGQKKTDDTWCLCNIHVLPGHSIYELL